MKIALSSVDSHPKSWTRGPRFDSCARHLIRTRTTGELLNRVSAYLAAVLSLNYKADPHMSSAYLDPAWLGAALETSGAAPTITSEDHST